MGTSAPDRTLASRAPYWCGRFDCIGRHPGVDEPALRPVDPPVRSSWAGLPTFAGGGDDSVGYVHGILADITEVTTNGVTLPVDYTIVRD